MFIDPAVAVLHSHGWQWPTLGTYLDSSQIAGLPVMPVDEGAQSLGQ